MTIKHFEDTHHYLRKKHPVESEFEEISYHDLDHLAANVWELIQNTSDLTLKEFTDLLEEKRKTLCKDLFIKYVIYVLRHFHSSPEAVN